MRNRRHTAVRLTSSFVAMLAVMFVGGQLLPTTAAKRPNRDPLI